MKPTASPKQALRKLNPDLSLLKGIQSQLQPHTESPYLDALELLSRIMGVERSQILAHPDPSLSPEQQDQLELALEKLTSGTPLPYVLGEWEFMAHSFLVTPDVLIPRPETEGLVGMALAWLASHPERRACLEIGTGCGCIAVSLAKSLPDLQITASDISPKALQLARRNASRHGVRSQIRFLHRDLLTGIKGEFDLLVANLPYIPSAKLRSLPVFHSEPTLALDGGEDGLHYIKQVLGGAQGHLRSGGAVFLEIDEDTGGAALALAHDVWPGITIQLEEDLSGQDRYLTIQCP